MKFTFFCALLLVVQLQSTISLNSTSTANSSKAAVSSTEGSSLSATEIPSQAIAQSSLSTILPSQTSILPSPQTSASLSHKTIVLLSNTPVLPSDTTELPLHRMKLTSRDCVLALNMTAVVRAVAVIIPLTVLSLCLIFAVTAACAACNLRKSNRKRRRSSISQANVASLHNNFGNLETILEESEVEDSVVEPQRQGVECLNMVNIPSRPEDIENLEYDEVKKRNTLIDLVTNEAYREPFQ